MPENAGQRRGAEPAQTKEDVPAVIQEPEISVVIPVYRNKGTLAALHRRLRSILDNQPCPYEILFVDDACPEDSLGVLANLAEMDPHVAVVALARNVGQQRAVLVGLRYARGGSVVILDADLQDPPEVIPSLLARLQEGPAAVFAGRRGHYESGFRLCTSRIFKWLLHRVCDVPRDAGLFVALNRQLVERLLTIETPWPFVVGMIGCSGLPSVSIPVERAPRADGISAYTMWGRLRAGILALAGVLFQKGRRRQSAGPERSRVSEAPVKAFLGDWFASMK